LTDTHDFFAHVETNDNHFETYQIDLDSADPRLSGPLARYHFKIVNFKRAAQFHTRASSIKEKVNLNKVLQHFILHEDELWTWTKQRGLNLVSKNASNLSYLSDDIILYMHTNAEKLKVGEKMVEHS
jgi:hypothetical protein